MNVLNIKIECKFFSLLFSVRSEFKHRLTDLALTAVLCENFSIGDYSSFVKIQAAAI